MVCLGNICRSPLAQGILKSKLPSQNFTIDSAGTAAYHIGNKPDKRSIHIAKVNGLDIALQRARQFSVLDFKNFDIIYAMDSSNYKNILDLAQSKEDEEKVKLILNENPSISDKNVPDPYYGGDSGFEYVFKILNETCDIISDKLQFLCP
ncbi:MAG: low molecular weight phosphotyrosine protein phosphatase [Winogradskyella sp.]|uniref:low molecular weight protein-tyrosine-phosphatase n=1 Tax=Winogradskyella sp. TaxID=1883156 RepID=UPI0017F0C4AA|nr:low molecular weight protein-tyrosine-phosphatase [Winogradskyella sp.]MBT8245822.1 low molecular weight phosphotyrosine protein phosphatase [Winogradskyella sp.]NNK22593.1 low molecular weight phosphotyrosine protein phosphatase [Winogradskyella sp.]